MIIFAVWIIGSVLLGMFAAYRLGQTDPNYRDDVGGPFAVLVMAWPLVIVVALILLPFYGMYKRGDRNRKKKERI